MDENGALYFVTARPRMYGDRKFFLKNRGGIFGASPNKGNRSPFTGTYIKTKPNERCDVLMAGAPIPLDALPERPPELMDVSFMDEAYMGKNSWCWVEGAEWLYAGASPIVPAGCTCPTMRAHLDWYKRTFVSETYRHSIGVLDANGNLILHLSLIHI